MNKLIVELGVAENTDSDAPIPPPEPIAHSTATTGDTALIYMSGDGVGVLGGEGGVLVVVFHIINSYSWSRVHFSYLTNPTDKCVVGGGCATAGATNGMARNRAQTSSPMVWG